MRWTKWLEKAAVAVALSCCLAVGCNTSTDTGSGSEGSGQESAQPAAATELAQADEAIDDADLDTVHVAITGMS